MKWPTNSAEAFTWVYIIHANSCIYVLHALFTLLPFIYPIQYNINKPVYGHLELTLLCNVKYLWHFRILAAAAVHVTTDNASALSVGSVQTSVVPSGQHPSTLLRLPLATPPPCPSSLTYLFHSITDTYGTLKSGQDMFYTSWSTLNARGWTGKPHTSTFASDSEGICDCYLIVSGSFSFSHQLTIALKLLLKSYFKEQILFNKYQ